MANINIPFFKNISNEEIEHMAACGCIREQFFRKSSTILQSGVRTDELGLVITGSVRIEVSDIQGKNAIIDIITAGHIFAETYAICHNSLMIDAIAIEDSRVMFVNLTRLMDVRNQNNIWYPYIMTNLLQMSVKKNLAMSIRIVCATRKTIRERVLFWLYSESMKHGRNEFCISLNRQEMADYLNLDRSALSKELGRMRDDGLIEFNKNHFKLLRM